MKKIIELILLVICFPFAVYSQQWHEYSDSIISNIKKNDYAKASNFIQLVDHEIEKGSVKKDTIYADYIYRKGVVKSYYGDFDTTLFKESLNIWESSSKKNYTKILKINFFTALNYFSVGNQSQNKLDYDKSYEHYEKCYFLVKKYNLQKQTNLMLVLYSLSEMDYKLNKNYAKAKKYAGEYIDYIKEIGIKDFDFDYVQALRFKQDNFGQEKVLLEYLAKYESQKLNDSKLLFRIYYELFTNKSFFENKINLEKNPVELIKYGEKALEVWSKEKFEVNKEIENLYSGLYVAYSTIGDNINKDKYDSLSKINAGKEDEIDYYTELENLYKSEDYPNFKIKFDLFKTDLKSKNDYNELLEIYKFSLTLFERSLLFTKDDIGSQLALINTNRSSLTAENKVDLDLMLAEFYIVTNQIKIALDICDKNLNTEDPYQKLKFYQFKTICESALGENEKAINTVHKTLEIAISIYGDNDPQILPYLIGILDLDTMSTDPNSIRLATRALKILYDNKLEQTTTAVSVWDTLGTQAMNKYNYTDALIYFEKSKSIIENAKPFNKPYLYYSCLVNLGIIYTTQNDFNKAKEYLDKTKHLLDSNPNFLKEWFETYYYALGIFYFYQDQFVEAKLNFEKSFSFYDSNKNSAKKMPYILCDYILDNDVNKAIARIEKYQKENNDTFWGQSILYILKYNSGNFVSAQNILIKQLNGLISDNNQYFQLLSYDEKEILHKKFITQFEFLNTFLLDNDSGFLKQYINFRFYSKSLLFSNSVKSNIENEKNNELYVELKRNTIQINKAIESKSVDLKEIEDLKNKNREIEKFLSANTKPLVVPNLKDLKNKLKQEEAYIEIIRINKQSRNSVNKGADIVKMFSGTICYGAIVIKKNADPKFVLIDDTNQLENKFSTNFYNKIKTKQEDSESYNLLFEKIDKELQGVNKIYLVTDGVYNSINIESIFNPNKKQYVLDYLKVQPIQNVRTIIEDKKEFKVSSSSKASLFGNPDFDLKIATKANIEFDDLSRDLDANLLDAIRGGLKLSSLSGTEREIENLSSILKNAKCTVEIYSTNTATEDNLKNVKSPNILHIATHGYFLKNDDASKTKQSLSDLFNDNYKNDPYMKSMLFLAGAQNTIDGKQLENANNGILTAEEAKRLNLKGTELVVLSACETGLGDNLVGEGVIGLQRAFMIAGAKSVIMSLWSVSDEKTQQLMTLFYTNWIKNNMSKEEAFYQAKIELKKMYPQPYYWAGFVLLE